MEEKKFAKLSGLVGDQFTVESVGDYVFKKWNPSESKMEVSQDWQEGFRKIYPVTTDKGIIDMGSGQLGSLLEAVFYGGKSDLVGRTFAVKSNGKMGLDIRYYFNPVKGSSESTDPKVSDTPSTHSTSRTTTSGFGQSKDTIVPFDDTEPINLQDIPF